MQNHYIIMLDGSSYRPMYDSMLQDVCGREDVTILSDVKTENKLKELLLKRKVQKLTGGCLDFLGYEQNNLYACIAEKCKTCAAVYVVFINTGLWYNPYLAGTLRKYRAQFPNLRYVLFYLDIIGAGVSRNADYLRNRNIFDLVYSFDHNNVRTYGLEQWRTIYSKDEKKDRSQTQWDLYFCCGVGQKRIGTLSSFLSQCAANGIRYKMDLVCYEEAKELEKFRPEANLLRPDQLLNYNEVLARELQANCMLEIVQPGQTGLTLRPYEAVVYNRKLLTNCKSILDFPYYNPAYMQYFEKVQDIDWQWVKDETPVDYDYKGDFSPALLLEDIKRRLG